MLSIEQEGENMLIGYARVSTEEQNLDRQIDQLLKCTKDLLNIVEKIKNKGAVIKSIKVLSRSTVIRILKCISLYGNAR